MKYLTWLYVCVCVCVCVCVYISRKKDKVSATQVTCDHSDWVWMLYVLWICLCDCQFHEFLEPSLTGNHTALWEYAGKHSC